jgi:hypothetical protein
MDRETLNEMVRLKFDSRKVGGPDIDLVKLAGDATYAAEIFSAVEQLPDESLVLLAITLRDKFGLLPAKPAPSSVDPSPTHEKPEAPPPQRYMRGARS